MRKMIVSVMTGLAVIGALQVLPVNAEPQVILKVPGNYPTIQGAINASADGTMVLVAPGIYFEKINFLGKAIVVRSESGPTETVIDASRTGTVVTFESGESAGSVLEGFTLQHGLASFGAGVRIWVSSPTIIGNIFDTNEQGYGGFGAGVGGNLASPRIERNIFRNNNCENDPQSPGVVSFVNDSSPRIFNNIFVNNFCPAISMVLPEGNSPMVMNNTIVGNPVGIHVNGGVNTVLHQYRNNVVLGNEVGLEVEFGSEDRAPTWENNLVFNNVMNYEGITDRAGVLGNISADPLFVDQAHGDFHLSLSSPAIDAGKNTSSGLPEKDFEGNQRVVDGNGDGVAVVDMGAYESITSLPTISFARFNATLQLFRSPIERDHFVASGNFTLGDGGDGINLLTDRLMFSLFDANGVLFQQVLSSGSFRQSGQTSFQYSTGNGSGIYLMIVRSTTTSGEYGFEIQGRKDDLRDVDAQSVTVSLKIGNDLGVQAIPCRSLSKGIDFCR